MNLAYSLGFTPSSPRCRLRTPPRIPAAVSSPCTWASVWELCTIARIPPPLLPGNSGSISAEQLWRHSWQLRKRRKLVWQHSQHKFRSWWTLLRTFRRPRAPTDIFGTQLADVTAGWSHKESQKPRSRSSKQWAYVPERLCLTDLCRIGCSN